MRTKQYLIYNCLLGVMALPSVGRAQFNLMAEDGTIAIISYTGPGGVVSIPSTEDGLPVSTIGPKAFYNCSTLTSITIPDSVTCIGVDAFLDCSGLTNVTIGNGVTYVGNLAFAGCTSLTSVTIPSSAASIQDQAFAFCTSLANATIDNGVTSIGSDMFEGCTSLTNVTIGYGATTIEFGAFSECTSLLSICFLGNAPTNCELPTFDGCPLATVYYLPGTTGWGPTFCGVPTAQWALPNPIILNFEPSMGVHSNQFGFVVSWANHPFAVVQASTNFSNARWQPIQTNTLMGGSAYFTDPEWTNYPARYYLLRAP